MDAYNLNTADVKAQRVSAQQAKNALPELPSDPLEAQMRYKEDSTRYIILYGTGEYNFGIPPNADMGIMIDVPYRLPLFLAETCSETV